MRYCSYKNIFCKFTSISAAHAKSTHHKSTIVPRLKSASRGKIESYDTSNVQSVVCSFKKRNNCVMKRVVVKTDVHLKSRSLAKAFFPSSVRGAALASPFDHGLCKSRSFLLKTSRSPAIPTSVLLSDRHNPASPWNQPYFSLPLAKVDGVENEAWCVAASAPAASPPPTPHAKTRLIFPHETRSPPARRSRAARRSTGTPRGGSGGPLGSGTTSPDPRRPVRPAQRQVYTKAGVQGGS